jgi:hypothetical protein
MLEIFDSLFIGKLNWDSSFALRTGTVLTGSFGILTQLKLQVIFDIPIIVIEWATSIKIRIAVVWLKLRCTSLLRSSRLNFVNESVHRLIDSAKSKSFKVL